MRRSASAMTSAGKGRCRLRVRMGVKESRRHEIQRQPTRRQALRGGSFMMAASSLSRTPVSLSATNQHASSRSLRPLEMDAPAWPSAHAWWKTSSPGCGAKSFPPTSRPREFHSRRYRRIWPRLAVSFFRYRSPVPLQRSGCGASIQRSGPALLAGVVGPGLKFGPASRTLAECERYDPNNMNSPSPCSIAATWRETATCSANSTTK